MALANVTFCETADTRSHNSSLSLELSVCLRVCVCMGGGGVKVWLSDWHPNRLLLVFHTTDNSARSPSVPDPET